MKAIIKTQDGISTLKLDIDFNQLLDDNFEEICKAIAARVKAFKELITVFETNNELIETILQILKSSCGVEDAIMNLCKALNISNTTAQYVTNIRIDELSSFKNGKSKRFKAMCQIRPMINRIIGLTGTPAPNSLIDLWGEYRILDLGQRLGRFITHYRSLYFIPGASNGNVVFEYIPISGAEEAIFRKISDITISMNAVDHLKMPDLIKTEYKVYLSDSEYKKYRNFKRQLAIEIKGEVITAANAAVLSNKLLQVANGAIYEEESKEYVDIHDKKLDALEDIIEQANGKPILCAYWFKHDLERIKAKLSTIPNITFDEIKSDESIARWNKGKINVGLIHPMSAGHGLNLQSGGNTIVWYSLCFSLEAYQQTNARLYRQGQKASTVVVIHLVADGTIDEHALKVLQGKSDVQNAVLDAVKADLKGE